MNKYLEKIASTIDEDFEKARGSNLQLHTTGVYGVNSRLKDMGYDSNINKILRTHSNSRMGVLKSLGISLGAAGVGGVAGAVGSKLAKVHPATRSLYALGGSQLGVASALIGIGHNDLTKKFPARLKEEMHGGTYKKVKAND